MTLPVAQNRHQMATQGARSIRFTHASPQQAFRLLELTPELLELLTSEKAPILHLKSPRSDPSQTAASDTHYVHLCTPSKTFRLRQVHSSNSIHLIRPSNGDVVPIAAENDDAANGLDLRETVTAIAKCGSTLELHAVDESFSATQILQQRLRLYDRLSVDGDTEMGDGGQSSALPLSEKNRVMDEILDDVPTSAAQCRAAWTELSAFVQTDTTSVGVAAFRPSARVKIDVWRRILEGSVLQSIDLEKQFLVKDLWKTVLGDDGEQPFPQPLFQAVVQRLSESSAANVHESFYSELKWSNMHKATAIGWVGEMYLEASAPTERLAIGRSEFIDGWKDLLPESWRNEASINSLSNGSYKCPDPVSICIIKTSDRNSARKDTSASASAVVKNSRNWHERLKSQR